MEAYCMIQNYRSCFSDQLTLDQLTNEYVEWIRIYGDGRNLDDLRFGQYLVDKYGIGKSCPEIFYDESAKRVYVVLGLEYI